MIPYLLRRILNQPVGYYTYIWQDVILVRKNPKAILILFDGQKAWIPKAWLRRIKRNKGPYVIKAYLLAIDSLSVGQIISIQLSEYHWVKKIG